MLKNLHQRFWRVPSVSICVLLLCQIPVFAKNHRTQTLDAPDFIIDRAVQIKDHFAVAMLNGESLPDHSYSIITHGRPGEILVEGRWYKGPDLTNFLKNKIPPLSRHLFIFGCEFAKGPVGRKAVKSLESELGVEIFASSDITGKGGNWILEYGNFDASFLKPYFSGSLQCAGTAGGTGINDDFDGDGVCNGLDLDDDNDGIPDAAECDICLTPGKNLLKNGSFENRNACPDGSIATSVHFADNWASYNQSLSTPQIMVWDPANGCTMGKPATSWPLSSQLKAGSDGKVWAGGHKEESFGQILDCRIPVGTNLRLTLDAIVASNDGTNSASAIQGGFEIYLLPPGVVFARSSSTTPPSQYRLVPNTPVTSALTATNNANGDYNGLWQHFDFNFTLVTEGSQFVIVSYGAGDFGYTYYDNINLSIVSYSPTETFCNVDGDGFPNHMDLNSDGDNCSDAYESGATLIKTPDYQFTAGNGGFADSNGDGLTDVVDVGHDGAPDYKLKPYFLSAGTSLCDDFDGDKLADVADIDDDNDGIEDAVESPSCFIDASQMARGDRTDAVTVTTTMLMNASQNMPSSLIDGIKSTTPVVVFLSNQTLNYNELYRFKFLNPTKLEGIYVRYTNGNTHFNSARIQLQGSFDGANWTGLNSEATYDNSPDNGLLFDDGTARYDPFLVDVNKQDYYTYYRIFAISGTLSPNGNANEVYFDVTNDYVASDFPKATCNENTDATDGPNHRDLDSDGDGCSDSFEAGAITTEIQNHQFTSEASSTGDTNGDGLADIVDANLNSIADYILKPYAYNPSLSLCKDADSDGYPDLADVDDDNDGIMDALENPGCYYTQAQIESGNRQSLVTISSPVTPLFGGSDFLKLVNGAYAADPDDRGVRFNNTTVFTNQEFLKYTFADPIAIDAIYHSFASYDNVSSFSANTIVRIEGSNNNSTWTPLSSDITYDNQANGSNPFTPGLNKSDNFVVTQNKGKYKYYRLFVVQGSVGGGNHINEVFFELTGFVPSANPKSTCTATDTDHDGIPNDKDLDSDGDGCADAIEGTGGFTVANLVESMIAGGNSGAGYTGVTFGVVHNLGNTVNASGLPTAAGSGQAIGNSQITAAPGARCAPLNSLIAVNDINETPIGIQAQGNVLTNDRDPENNMMTVNATPVTSPAHGTVVLNSNGSYIYTPENTYTGLDSFTYRVCDNGVPQACRTATVTIQAIPVVAVGNNPPIANDDTGTTPNSVSLTGKVTNNDSDPDGNPLTVNAMPISGPAHGSILINANGTFTYTPTSGYVGQDIVVYQVCDNGSPALCDQAKLVITVTGPNTTNVTYANDDAGIARKGVTMTGNVEDNDSDPESQDLEAGSFRSSAGTLLNADGNFENVLPSGGKLVVSNVGTYTYKPASDFVGSEVVTYFSCDNGAPTACAQATLYLTTLDLDSELPVTLIDFKARRSGEGALLEWHTAAEKDFDRFELEASAYGTKDFNLMSTLKGGKSSYTYTDRTLTADARYYRLKMIDTDGTFAYSRIISVSAEGGGITSSLYPNPVYEHKLYLRSGQMIDSYQVYDAAGKPIAARIGSRGGDQYEITLDARAQPGVYILIYRVQGQTITHKFLVSN